ncbi:MAG TPA: type II toxin-antitoxin system death-on-curing family toxin [Chloroflexia bacterium]|nr:type II toxin-antitoxin system death-on-curing family toxin [Chloroflexia bacterium]
MNPTFLSLEDIMELHEDQVIRYGGSTGVRDMNLLLSASEMPKASFGGEFLHEDLHSMAAAYLFHIVQNHPFIDGNKRAGLASAIAFLRLNGTKLRVDHDALYEMVLEVAQGNLQKPAIADFLKRHTQPAPE